MLVGVRECMYPSWWVRSFCKYSWDLDSCTYITYFIYEFQIHWGTWKSTLKWEMENEIIRKWGRVSSVILWIALRSRAHNFQSLRTPLPAYSQVDESLATDLVELGFYPSLPCQLLAQVTFHWCRLQNLLILLESWMWMWEKMYSKI